MRTFNDILVALASLAVALALVGSSGVPAAAQEPPRGKLIVTVSDSPDPAASGGQVVYAILIKNDSITKAKNVLVTIPIPPDTAVFKCTVRVDVEGAESTPCPPPAGDTMAVFFFNIKAHKQPRINLTLTMPVVSVPTPVIVSAFANGDDVDDEGGQQTTTVVPPNAVPVTFFPSGRSGLIACGLTLAPDYFGTDTIVKLGGDIGCTSGPYGLKITASGKTLDLNLFKIFWNNASLVPGNAGILVSRATDVTIIGGSTGGNSGIESFDWCVKDEAPSARLTITSLRCFRARTAGFDITSRKASITGVLVDSAIGGTAANTAEMPGGVGIRTRGDNASIKDSIVRRARTIGIWVSGIDATADGRVASIVGDKASCSTTTGSKMLIERGTGVGLLLHGGPHFVKNVCVKDLYNDRADPPVEGNNGVVVGPTGLNNLLDGVVVKQYGGNAFVVDGTGTTIMDSNVDLVGLDGFVVTGPGSTLSGNGVQNARHGFIITATALDADLETNETEDLDGDGFVVDGDTAALISNSAQGNGGRGFVIGGDSGLFDNNTAENNVADGFVVTGSNNIVKNNTAQSNDGIGFLVSGSGNDFNTNSASGNDGTWEWQIGPGQTQIGGKTNKVSGKTFCIPPAGVNINSVIGTGPPCP